MSNVTNLSTSTESAPMGWVDSLFSRMGACYGSKFADMWRDSDLKLVKQLWAEEMGKLSHAELKHGYQSLMTKVWPPSLPEYVLMCKSLEKPIPAHTFALPAPKSEFSRENATKMLDTLGASGVMKSKTDHRLWAKLILKKAKQPLHGLSSLQIRFAKEAMASKAEA